MVRVEYDFHGPSGNIYFIMGQAFAAIGEEKGREMARRVTKCGSYDQALDVIREYVELVDVSENA